MVRFQRRISLGPGLRLNLSKSGLGLSMGVKGFSLSTGTRGPSLNVGLPGTGLSQRISLNNNNKPSNSTESIKYDFSNVSISIDNDGTIQVCNQHGQPLDDVELRRLKRTEGYKETIKSLNLDLYNRVEDEKQHFIEIFKNTPHIKTDNNWKTEIEEINSQLIVKRYTESKPTEERCRKELWQEANENIKSVFFWTNSRKRQEYVDKKFQQFFNDEISNWEKRKKAFETSDITRIEILEHRKEAILNRIIPGENNYVNESISSIIKDLSTPIDFFMEYDYFDDGTIFVDLDLPEIEDLPTKKANILATGKISLKEKTQKELKEEYAKCVCGLAFFFAGHLFNISPKIFQIVISGYTQRIDKKTGSQNDDYIYSIKFLREPFEKLLIKNIEPVEAFNNFENKIDIKSNFEMKKIIPFV